MLFWLQIAQRWLHDSARVAPRWLLDGSEMDGSKVVGGWPQDYPKWLQRPGWWSEKIIRFMLLLFTPSHSPKGPRIAPSWGPEGRAAKSNPMNSELVGGTKLNDGNIGRLKYHISAGNMRF